MTYPLAKVHAVQDEEKRKISMSMSWFLHYAVTVSVTYPVAKIQVVQDVDALPGGEKFKLSKMENKHGAR